MRGLCLLPRASLSLGVRASCKHGGPQAQSSTMPLSVDQGESQAGLDSGRKGRAVPTPGQEELWGWWLCCMHRGQ